MLHKLAEHLNINTFKGHGMTTAAIFNFISMVEKNIETLFLFLAACAVVFIFLYVMSFFIGTVVSGLYRFVLHAYVHFLILPVLGAISIIRWREFEIVYEPEEGRISQRRRPEEEQIADKTDLCPEPEI